MCRGLQDSVIFFVSIFFEKIKKLEENLAFSQSIARKCHMFLSILL